MYEAARCQEGTSDFMGQFRQIAAPTFVDFHSLIQRLTQIQPVRDCIRGEENRLHTPQLLKKVHARSAASYPAPVRRLSGPETGVKKAEWRTRPPLQLLPPRALRPGASGSDASYGCSWHSARPRRPAAGGTPGSAGCPPRPSPAYSGGSPRSGGSR